MRTLPNPVDSPLHPATGATVLPDATGRIDNGPVLRAEVEELERRLGVLAWFGFHTRRWWALDENRLIEGANPARLADAVMAARRWAR